jgi:hypothetical protein
MNATSIDLALRMRKQYRKVDCATNEAVCMHTFVILNIELDISYSSVVDDMI